MDRVEALEQQVAELEKALAAARQSEAQQHDHVTWLRLAAEASGIGLWRWDAEGDRVTWDRRLCMIFGVEEGPQTYASWRARLHPEDADRVVAHVLEARRTGVYHELEHRIVRPDGVVRWIHARASVELDAEGRFLRLMGAVVDVTERRELEERARQAAKMDALARLAAGVAHNFNNLLAIAVPSIDEASRLSTAVDSALGPARDAVRHAVSIVRELSRLAGDEKREHARVDLALVIQRAVDACRASFGDWIDWRVELATPLPPVNVDARRMEQAIVNVLTNARDALLFDSVVDAIIEVRASVSGNHVNVSITDSGVGMDEATRANLFEPFFTTKGPTSVAGLGLAAAYSIARAHGGSIECRSRPGEGAQITFSLPIDEAATAHAATRVRSSRLRGRGERVLLVDDERLLRRVLRTLLESAGYEVFEAVDGADAIAMLSSDRSLALVILDRSMPNMSGPEVMAWIERERPELRVIGYSGLDEPIPGVRAMLTKPVEPDVLLATVRAVLDGP